MAQSNSNGKGMNPIHICLKSLSHMPYWIIQEGAVMVHKLIAPSSHLDYSFWTSCASSRQLLLIPEAVKRVSFGVDKNGDSTTSWLSALDLSCCSKHPRPWPSNRCRCPRHPHPWPFQWWCRYWCCCSSPRRWP